MKFQRIVWSILASVWLIGPAHGISTVDDGTDKIFWTNHAVVVCEVGKVTAEDGGDVAEIRMVAVVTTDILLPTSMTLKRMPCAAPNSAILDHLTKGETAVLCIERRKDYWSLTRNGLPFFPSNCAIQHIKGLDDPVLAQIVANVQKARSAMK